MCVCVLVEYKYSVGCVYFLPLPYPLLLSLLFAVGDAVILHDRCISYSCSWHFAKDFENMAMVCAARDCTGSALFCLRANVTGGDDRKPSPIPPSLPQHIEEAEKGRE